MGRTLTLRGALTAELKVEYIALNDLSGTKFATIFLEGGLAHLNQIINSSEGVVWDRWQEELRAIQRTKGMDVILKSLDSEHENIRLAAARLILSRLDGEEAKTLKTGHRSRTTTSSRIGIGNQAPTTIESEDFDRLIGTTHHATKKDKDNGSV